MRPRLGAAFPMRYDPEDQEALGIDSIVLGYSAPCESIKSMIGFVH